MEIIKLSDPGNNVNCDYCSDDYTDSKESGGFMFGSYATCPKCVIRMMPNIDKFGEHSHIRSRCPEDKSFADWIRDDIR